MSENPTLVPVHLPSSVSNYPSWHANLNALGEDGTWGDRLAPIAAANVNHMSIAIVSLKLSLFSTEENTDFIVGKNTDDATRRSMRNMIGHEASLLFNITGAKGKLAFNQMIFRV